MTDYTDDCHEDKVVVGDTIVVVESVGCVDKGDEGEVTRVSHDHESVSANFATTSKWGGRRGVHLPSRYFELLPVTKAEIEETIASIRKAVDHG